MSTNELAQVLEKCRQTSVEGFAIARQNNDKLGEAINAHQEKLGEILDKFKGKTLPSEVKKYIKQLENALVGMKNLHNEIDAELENNKDNLKDFTIVVYGKTMAGKSTLMETLLNGNGQSIGKGTQRTTLDVRSYRWKNLQIYDTPGIAASDAGGRKDEKKAYEIAKEADMIIFLLDDDNISDEEAKAFSKLKKMGKPMLVVVNIKYDLTSKRSADFKLKKINKHMAKERIEALEKDFIAHVENQEVTWTGIRFVGVHLQAAYLSLKGETPINSMSAKELAQRSNFKDIEKAVVNEIISKGIYYQYKVFIDIAYKQTDEMFGNIRKELNLLQGMASSFSKNRKKLKTIKENFKKYGLHEVDYLINKIKRNLESQVDDFTNYYYDVKSAGDAWQEIIEKESIEEKCKYLFERLGKDCSELIEEFQKEFAEEISLRPGIGDVGSDIKGDDITDDKFNFTLAVDIGGALLAGASLLGLISIGLGPIGWTVTGLTVLFSWLFDDKDEKIREAKSKMRNSLEKSIGEIEDKLNKIIPEAFEKTFIEGYINKVEKQFNDMADRIDIFNESEQKLSDSLSRQLNNMNIQILKAACESVGMPDLIEKVVRIERVIGQSFTIIIKDIVDVSDNERKKLEELLQEKVMIAHDTQLIKI